jgi:hypothetical protein
MTPFAGAALNVHAEDAPHAEVSAMFNHHHEEAHRPAPPVLLESVPVGHVPQARQG